MIRIGNNIGAPDIFDTGLSLIAGQIRETLIARNRSVCQKSYGHCAVFPVFIDTIQMTGMDDIRAHSGINLWHGLLFLLLFTPNDREFPIHEDIVVHKTHMICLLNAFITIEVHLFNDIDIPEWKA
jgi:hypothetical protein